MPSLNYAVITPSYPPDYFRCRLLCESLQRYLVSPYVHYIVVEQKDVPLFSQLKGTNTEILTVQECIPSWIFRLPVAKRWWLSLKSPPIRNWIMQQIVKISMAKYLSQDVFVYIDSDTAFIQSFDLRSFEKGDKVRLFSVYGGGNITSHYKWHRSAGRILGIPVQDYYGARYITQLVTWRRSVVHQLYERIETVHGKDWMDVLTWQWNLSEYVLYGVFVDQVLKEKALHYHDEKNYCLEYWLEQDMKDEEIEAFLNKLNSDHVAIMISAKAKMSTERYNALLEKAREKIANLGP